MGNIGRGLSPSHPPTRGAFRRAVSRKAKVNSNVFRRVESERIMFESLGRGLPCELDESRETTVNNATRIH